MRDAFLQTDLTLLNRNDVDTKNIFQNISKQFEKANHEDFFIKNESDTLFI